MSTLIQLRKYCVIHYKCQTQFPEYTACAISWNFGKKIVLCPKVSCENAFIFGGCWDIWSLNLSRITARCIDRGMALQSPLVYGRIFASQLRQLVPRVLSRQDEYACRNSRRYTQLVTAYCGFSKDIASSSKRYAFGEDAFFVAEDRARNVLGKVLTTICFYDWKLCVVYDRRNLQFVLIFYEVM